jgi:hypothetical protein
LNQNSVISLDSLEDDKKKKLKKLYEEKFEFSPK